MNISLVQVMQGRIGQRSHFTLLPPLNLRRLLLRLMPPMQPNLARRLLRLPCTRQYPRRAHHSRERGGSKSFVHTAEHDKVSQVRHPSPEERDV